MRQEAIPLVGLNDGHLNDIIEAIGDVMRKMQGYNEHNKDLTIYMPMLLKGMLEAQHIANQEEDLPATEVAEIYGAKISVGYEKDAIVVTNTMKSHRPNNPLIALEGIFTGKLKIVERHLAAAPERDVYKEMLDRTNEEIARLYKEE